MDVETSPFPADALPANRNGQLTESQRRNLGNYERDRQQSTRRFALIPVAIAVIILFAPGLKGSASVHYGVPFICIVIAIVLTVRTTSGSDRMARDLREGRVASFEGAVNKRGSTTLNSNTAPTRYLLNVGGKRFDVGGGTYDALPDGGSVRVYYLPRSNYVVNVEQTRDDPIAGSPSVPDTTGTIDANPFARDDRGTFGSDPFGQDILGSLGSDPFASGWPAGNEAESSVQTTVDPIEERFNQQMTSPTGMVSEPPSLADAIVGTWRSPMMTATFRADGTVEGTARSGMKRTGHWSVGDDGLLQTDVLGSNQAVEAKVQGDQLTITLGGGRVGLTFDRVAS